MPLFVQKEKLSEIFFFFQSSYHFLLYYMGFPHSLVSKESACNAGDLGLIPGSGRSPGEGNGNPLQYSCLENPMDRGALQATVHRVARVGHDLATKPPLYYISSVQSLSHVQLFATSWTTACQASLSFSISWSLLKLMSTGSVMPSNHLILAPCFPLTSIFPSIRVFSNESVLHIKWPKYWSFSI